MRGMSASNAAAGGYLRRVIASSSASVYRPRGRKPLYQMSKGSSGRPRRYSTSFATRGSSGDPSTASSIASTRCSDSSRPSSKRRAMNVGAEGE